MVGIILVFLILLFILLYKKREGFQDISDKKIIIIGNAPFDKNKKMGKLIDSFDKVVRFNSFKIDDFKILEVK